MIKLIDGYLLHRAYQPWNICYFGVTETAAVAATAASAASASAAASASVFSLANIGLAASIASAGIGAIGAISSGNAQAAAAKYNSQIASQNATLADQNAKWARESGEQQVGEQGAKTRAQVGGIIAAQAANGVDVNSGSAPDVRASEASLGQLSAINIRSNAARTSYGFETQSTSDTAQSQLENFQSSQDSLAGEVSGASTILGGAGGAASSYALFNQQNSPLTSA